MDWIRERTSQGRVGSSVDSRITDLSQSPWFQVTVETVVSSHRRSGDSFHGEEEEYCEGPEKED